MLKVFLMGRGGCCRFLGVARWGSFVIDVANGVGEINVLKCALLDMTSGYKCFARYGHREIPSVNGISAVLIFRASSLLKPVTVAKVGV